CAALHLSCFLEPAKRDQQTCYLAGCLLLPGDRAVPLAQADQFLPEGNGVAEGAVAVLIVVGGDGERVHDRARALPTAGAGDEFVGFGAGARVPRLVGAGVVVLVASGAGNCHGLAVVAEPATGADEVARDRFDRVDQEDEARPGAVASVAGEGETALD